MLPLQDPGGLILPVLADVLPIPARMPSGAQAPAPIAGAASQDGATIDYGAPPPHSREDLSMDLSRVMDLVDAEARMEERMVAFEHEVSERAAADIQCAIVTSETSMAQDAARNRDQATQWVIVAEAAQQQRLERVQVEARLQTERQERVYAAHLQAEMRQ